MQPETASPGFNPKWLIPLVCLIGALIITGVLRISHSPLPNQLIGKGVNYLADREGSLTVEEVQLLPDAAWQKERDPPAFFWFDDLAVLVSFYYRATVISSRPGA